MLQKSIDSARPINPNLWAVTNVFDPCVLENLLLKIQIETNWIAQEMQEHKSRVRLPWTENGLIDEIWSMIDKLDFSKFDLKFRTVTIWKDSPGYLIDEHVDNEKVEGSMQIYLNDAPKNLGTWFQDIEFPFVKNSGYIMRNTDRPKHGMKCMVPPNTTRLSLYAWFDYIEGN